MDVDQASIVASDEIRAEYAHEPRQHNESRPVRVNGIGERGIETFTAGVGFVIHDPGSDMCAKRAIQSCSPRSVADDGAQFEGAVRIARGVDDCLQIAAATGNQDYDGKFFPTQE